MYGVSHAQTPRHEKCNSKYPRRENLFETCLHPRSNVVKKNPCSLAFSRAKVGLKRPIKAVRGDCGDTLRHREERNGQTQQRSIALIKTTSLDVPFSCRNHLFFCGLSGQALPVSFLCTSPILSTPLVSMSYIFYSSAEGEREDKRKYKQQNSSAVGIRKARRKAG